MKKTILITGASRGFGRIWTEAFLKRGDNVIATARNTESLNDLIKEYGNSILPLQLDVTNRAQCFEVVNKAYEHFGKLDVVINNAGYGLFGTIEEASEKEAREQFETNVFGTLWITQAAIPVMRNQGNGHIIQISSLLGIASVPTLGIYSASKWAVEAISEAMVGELKSFGINTTIIEPASFATDWSQSSAVRSEAISVYDGVKSYVYAEAQKMPVGNPEATADVVLKIVDAENPPLRILFGKGALQSVKHIYEDRLSQWEQWSELSDLAHG